MQLKLTGVSLAAALALLSCAQPGPPAQAPSAGPPGASKASAIEVCLPPGEVDYLSRLVCENGQAPTFRRIGSFGTRTERPPNLSDAEFMKLAAGSMPWLRGAALKAGEPDFHMIDGYELLCSEAKRTVYLDMYHCAAGPTAATPEGFRLRSP
jgi:hypothetical protein